MEKARRVGRIYCEIEPGQVGPVEAKLLSYEQVRGLVFGAFGEVSQPVHQLIDALATSGVAVERPQRARMGLETQGRVDRTVMGERAIVVGQIRRRLSVAAVRAQSTWHAGGDGEWAQGGCCQEGCWPCHGPLHGTRPYDFLGNPPPTPTRN